MKLKHTITDAQGLALTQLLPRSLVYGEEALARSVDVLISQEQLRRGAPDPATGAKDVAALLQGSLLQREYDVGLHFDQSGWLLTGLVIDVKGMTLHNMRLGFPRGDELLRTTVATLGATLPDAAIVRLHGDAFAALFLPTLSGSLKPNDAERVHAALAEAMAPFSSSEEPVQFALAQLHLRIVQPAHWQVLGPLVWSEFERALLLERLGRASGLQERTIVLDAAIPGPPTTSNEW